MNIHDGTLKALARAMADDLTGTPRYRIRRKSHGWFEIIDGMSGEHVENVHGYGNATYRCAVLSAGETS